MTIPLGTQGQPDFTQPIELMMDCHRRIEWFLDVLNRVVARYERIPLDPEGREALETALNYFKQAAPRHTADEEQSLFPRMRRCNAPAAREAMSQIDRLEADHREAEHAHDRVETLGRLWLDRGRLDPEEVNELSNLLAKLTATYQEHIRLEEEQVFALADRVLNEQALDDIGREMQERRLASPGRPGSRCAQRRLSSPASNDKP